MLGSSQVWPLAKEVSTGSEGQNEAQGNTQARSLRLTVLAHWSGTLQKLPSWTGLILLTTTIK